MLTTRSMPVSQLADRLAVDLVDPIALGRPAFDEWQRLERFLRSARMDGFNLSDAVAVVNDAGGVLWACLGVRSAGKTSLLVLAPLPALQDNALPLHEALRSLARQETGAGIGLVQSLLSAAQQAEARLLLECGFIRLAELIYMQADLPDALLQTPGARDLWPERPGDTDELFRENGEGEFARVIQASYVRTLDCPGLEGLRRMEDVLAGHKASGIFRPDLWFMFRRAGEPIAIVLLNEIVDAAHTSVELVYMGLIESARGRGLGRRMFHRAMRAARRAGFTRILTAVDSANLPAVKLYRDMGFAETTRRVAYILPAPRVR